MSVEHAHSDAECLEAIARFRRCAEYDRDILLLLEHGMLGRNKRLTVKALRLLGSQPGSWYCPSHGLNGCDGRPKKSKGCCCPHRQERP